MRIDRARFLLLVAALSGCHESAPPAPSAPSAPTSPPSDAPAPTKAVAAARGDEGDGASTDAGAAAAAACNDSVPVPDCFDFGAPGPTCEKGMSPVVDCQRLHGVLRPSAARAAVSCMVDRRDACSVFAVGAANRCFVASLSSACEQKGVRATCASLASKCGKRLGEEECVAGISAVIDAIRPRMISCVTEHCSVDCFDTYDLRPAGPLPKAAPKSVPASPPGGALAAEVARWPARSAPLPASWLACRLSTDCAVVSTGACGSVAVSYAFAPVVRERVRLETKGKPENTTRSCRGAGPPECRAGVCTSR